ncbi:hypothetical protein GCM10020000_32880 [Streptomyces olivoverticillatus]
MNTFRRIADINVWATDGAFSPDGTRLVVRGYFEAIAYRWQDGRPTEIGRPSVPLQRQGESVTFTPDGRTLMYGSEGTRSHVTPVALSGDLLPDSAAEDKSGGRSPKGAARPTTSARRTPTATATWPWGAGTLAVGTLLALGLRRLLRARRG